MARDPRLRRWLRLAALAALVLVVLPFIPGVPRARVLRAWWVKERVYCAAEASGEVVRLEGARFAVVALDDHPAARGVADRLARLLEERLPEAAVERVDAAGAPYTGDAAGRLADVVALVDRVHSDGHFVPGHAHQMLRLNVALGASPRASSLAVAPGVPRSQLEYSIDGHADAFGLVPWSGRWRDATDTVAADLAGMLDREGTELRFVPSRADAGFGPGAALELPFTLDGALAGGVQEVYAGRRASGELARQWQLTTDGSGFAAVAAAEARAVEAGWEVVARRGGGPGAGATSLVLRDGADWLHVRPAYMEGDLRARLDAPQVLALSRWRVLTPADPGSFAPPR